MQDDRQDFLPYAYELRGGLDRARVARFEEAASEIEVEFVRDTPRARRHHDQMRRQEQRFLHAVSDEKAHLAGAVPDVEYQLLDGLAGERVERAAHAQAELDVLANVEPGHQGMFLEYDTAIGARAGDGLAVELDRSMRRRQKPGD